MERMLSYSIPATFAGKSIQRFLAHQGYSATILAALKQKPSCAFLNGMPCKLRETLQSGDLLQIHWQENATSPNIIPQSLPLDIIYEDADLIVVNKPPNMPMHPSSHTAYGTLANALAGYYAAQGIPFVFRCSNRLDRDTSGLTVIAKHSISAAILGQAAIAHTVKRRYLALCEGVPNPPTGTITAPVARKTGPLLAFEVNPTAGKHAVTHYRTVEALPRHALVELKLETGRTHQIRVHMQYLGHPLVGDKLYNPKNTTMARQALHAAALSFVHPITGETLYFTASLPQDFQAALEALRRIKN